MFVIRRSVCNPVTVCGVTVCGVVTVCCVVTVVTWFTVTVVPWCVAGGSTVTGVTTTRGDRDSNCDRGDGFRHPSHSHCHLVTVIARSSSITAVRFRLFRLFRTFTACRPQPPIRVDNRNPIPLR